MTMAGLRLESVRQTAAEDLYLLCRYFAGLRSSFFRLPSTLLINPCNL